MPAHAERQHEETQHPGHRTHREIPQDFVEARFDGREARFHAPFDQWPIGELTALVLPALEHGGEEIKLGQNVAETRRHHLLPFEPAAERQERHVDGEREGRRVAAERLVVAPHVARVGGRRKLAAGPRAHEGAERVGDAVPDMAPERLVELREPLPAVGILERRDLLEQVGMAADRALAELDEAAGDDVGALDRDADRHRTIAAAEIVERAFLDGLAAVDVHGVVGDHAQPLGRLLLHDGGDHRGLVTVVDGGAGEPARRVDQIGGGGHAPEPFLNGLELADRHVELLADARIGSGRVRGEGGAGGGERRQRDAASGRERAHQHLPTFADLRNAADHIVDRDEHVPAPGRTVLERVEGRQVTTPDLDAGEIGRHQRYRDADVVLIADQVIGIVQLEGKTEHGRDRPERDVTLVPVELDAENLAAFPGATAHHAGIDHRCGIRARLRTGEAEAGNLFRRRKPRQPVVLLRLGAELMQQLARSERVRHHGGDGRADRARRELADDLRMGVGGETEATVLLRDDHREELVRLEEVPDLGRQVEQFPIDLPIVHHVAELFDRAVEERLLLLREDRVREGEELLPIGIAGE